MNDHELEREQNEIELDKVHTLKCGTTFSISKQTPKTNDSEGYEKLEFEIIGESK